jgi:hypothetical protein
MRAGRLGFGPMASDFFSFFWIVQTGAKFKILYKFDLKLDKYEINFLG